MAGKTTAAGDAMRARIYGFITDYWTANGIAPTIREVARGIGLHPSSTHHHIAALERAGLLQSTPGTMRSLRVVAE
jgi:SOS-response transcriptional repressor LexA